MTDAAPLRYAIIGAGNMGQEHIRNLALLPGARVTAVADPDEGMRHQATTLAGGETRAFTNHGELLSADLADAYVIAAPNHTHAAVLEDVLAAGKPVLVEKPMCTTLADCDRIVALAANAPAPVWVAMEYRYMPPVAALIDHVRGGDIGRLRMLAIREHRYPFLQKVGDWNRFARNTGGTMVEKCCHFFDLMRLIVGAEPVRLYASGAQDVNHLDERYDGEVPDIVDNAFVVVDFANGVRAMLDLCMFAEGSRDEQEIAATGDVGKVECGVPSSTVILGERKTGACTTRTIPVDHDVMAAGNHHGATYFQHQAFADMVRGGGRPRVTVDDGRRAVMMGAAAEWSIRTGEPFDLDPSKS